MKGERREKGEGKTNLFGTKNERRMRRREGREERTNSCSGKSTRMQRKGEEERTNVCGGESRHMRGRGRGREERQMLVMERVHAKRRWEGEGDEETFVVESRRMRGRGGQTFVVQMVHLRMIDREGREEKINVCDGEGACETEGGGVEDK